MTESCSDASDDCPANRLQAGGWACGSSADSACTDPDTCKGGENTCLPNNTACSFVTNSELCSFDYDSTLNGRQFNAIFTPDPQLWPGYKLNATNPGQFYYNAIVTGAANTAGSVTMSVPWPFITQGANPVHVYDANSIGIDQNLCFRDGSSCLCSACGTCDRAYADWASGALKGGIRGEAALIRSSASNHQLLPNGTGYDCAVTINSRSHRVERPTSTCTLTTVSRVRIPTSIRRIRLPIVMRRDQHLVGDATYYDALQNDFPPCRRVDCAGDLHGTRSRTTVAAGRTTEMTRSRTSTRSRRSLARSVRPSVRAMARCIKTYRRR